MFLSFFFKNKRRKSLLKEALKVVETQPGGVLLEPAPASSREPVLHVSQLPVVWSLLGSLNSATVRAFTLQKLANDADQASSLPSLQELVANIISTAAI